MPTVLALLRGLAEYERLTADFKSTRGRLAADGFGPRRYFNALLCYAGRAPIGVALYYFTYSSFAARPALFLEDLFVVPTARRQGAGTALLVELARIARTKGCARMEWAVLDWNAPAIRFYERLGARVQRTWLLTHLEGAPLERLARGR